VKKTVHSTTQKYIWTRA